MVSVPHPITIADLKDMGIQIMQKKLRNAVAQLFPTRRVILRNLQYN